MMVVMDLGFIGVAANESIIVAVSDDADGLGYHPNNEMGLRDVSNLNYIRNTFSD